MASGQNALAKSFLKVEAVKGYSCVSFPGRRVFKMSQGVIQSRMKELTSKFKPTRQILTSFIIGFLNNLVRIDKCGVAPELTFNLLACPEFLDFVDPEAKFRASLSFAADA